MEIFEYIIYFGYISGAHMPLLGNKLMDIAVAMRKALPNDFGVKAGNMYEVRRLDKL